MNLDKAHPCMLLIATGDSPIVKVWMDRYEGRASGTEQRSRLHFRMECHDARPSNDQRAATVEAAERALLRLIRPFPDNAPPAGS